MPEVAFVMSAGQCYALRELAETLQYELGLQAVPSSLHLGKFPAQRPDRVYVLLNPSGFVAVEGQQALPDDAVLRRTIFVCAERPPLAEDVEHLDLLDRAGAVFVLEPSVRLALHRLGIAARLLRLGYSESLDRFDPDAPRPIDVMFLGSHSLRRTKYLSRAARVLARHDHRLHILETTPTADDANSVMARDRWRLLVQTKVVLNLHRGEDTGLEWGRALDAIHAGAVLVTEHSSDLDPLVPGRHLLVASADSLPYVAEAVMRDPQRLGSLRAQAHERLASWMPYALPVSILRAAVVELVGEPVPARVSLGAPRPEPAAPAPSAAPARDGHDSAIESSVALDPADLEVIHETDEWAAQRAPQLTVITALRGDPEVAIRTLDSLAQSLLREFELVVVDGGSVGQSRERVRSWLAGHSRLAARLVGGPSNELATARNAGLSCAGGPFCLILDAGQEVYPRCLEVLSAALQTRSDVAFAYPIQEVTGAPDAFVRSGGDYLMSFVEWDPARLRGGNPVYAPVLIRTDRLRELGGFTTDPRLRGSEDYDLWCRMAERGWGGQLVPQVLARRLESGSSVALPASIDVPVRSRG